MIIQCIFEDKTFDDGRSNYRCMVENKTINSNKELNFSGQHSPGKDDIDVQHVFFKNCNITKVPQGLKKRFPNITILSITYSNIENIYKEDLIEYKNMERFYCNNNQLEYIPGDLFEGFENLQLISLWGNKLKYVDPNIMNGLPKLRHINFRQNPNYDICFTNFPQYHCTASIEEVRNNLLTKNFKLFESLKKNESILKVECEGMKKKESELNEEIQNLQLQLKNFKTQTEKLSKKLNIALKLKNTKIYKIFDDKNRDFDIQNKDLFQAAIAKYFIDLNIGEVFIIKVNDEQFKVHKHLLAAKSKVFCNFLKENPNAEYFEINGINFDVFEQIYEFLYKLKLPEELNVDFFELFSACVSLEIPEMIKTLKLYIFKLVNSNNATKFFKFAVKYDLQDVIEKTIVFLKKRHPRVNFHYESKENLLEILEIVEKIDSSL